MTTPKGIEEWEEELRDIISGDYECDWPRLKSFIRTLISSVSSARDLEWREKLKAIKRYDISHKEDELCGDSLEYEESKLGDWVEARDITDLLTSMET